MTDQLPITPTVDLIRKWNEEAATAPMADQRYIATQAARWGADQELEACVEWLEQNCGRWELPAALRAARRPKPQSLKEQAVFAAAVLRSPDETCSIAEIEQHWHTIRRALEALDD